ncbi:MAG: 1-(5-phosphoribosyl)-5-[(5-phosphoribosylamino)methylideneamino]imidazole-4-carboxamide isomerase [Planctomycetota bacterium]|nr:MAG: 1-(5-phosphoribosyl)-5-[(5-phosphoribosylamino)methylideneamino]imidazole-4-carboxamide isomerase [Planctomycetota bacterium]REJ93843.1 MAG: 1-(5-phosphoribosyl)-5-[(5-phosphoribosylamino)methylideneamino]imidazole-4-carboxamide isomerase [Planctomycetota bacterium]REK20921.1 MAG: 1-(5-phosphoribosyl)-5-[(5-phosphoribosylamino)methylideneamino]imidazole-4-carboxamide isomerase [Planctomycetota bacterium]REK37298.1 MAG: 1-(5-phosphoribosyl)-5-[(5-phosphoribosylamino)methylideneamino]imida
MQIIPAIDIRGGQCVRLRQGDYNQETVFSNDPAEMAVRWMEAGAERLHLVDLDAAKAGRPVNIDAIRKIVKSVQIPCQLGGGVRDEAAIRLLVDDLGIERAIIGTAALKQPDWFRSMIGEFPGRLCLGLDAKDSMIATEGWLDVSRTSALELARQYEGLDLAAVIYTNIANDGMLQGIDRATIVDLCALADLGFPVIASGGVTTVDDVRRLREASRAHPQLVGAIVGRALYERTLDLPDAIRAASS